MSDIEVEKAKPAPAEPASDPDPAVEADPPGAAALAMTRAAAVPVFAFAIGSMFTGTDRAIALFMKTYVNEHMAYFWRFMTDRGEGTLYVVVALMGLFGGIGLKRLAADQQTREIIARAQRYCYLVLMSLAASGAILHSIKFLSGRHRPRDLFASGTYGFEPFAFTSRLDSFPSGHSQTIFCVTTALALAFPKHWKQISFVGLLVALSRVTMTNHFVSDVAVGSWLGIITVLMLAPYALRERETGWLSAHAPVPEGERNWQHHLRLGRVHLHLDLHLRGSEKKDD